MFPSVLSGREGCVRSRESQCGGRAAIPFPGFCSAPGSRRPLLICCEGSSSPLTPGSPRQGLRWPPLALEAKRLGRANETIARATAGDIPQPLLRGGGRCRSARGPPPPSRLSALRTLSAAISGQSERVVHDTEIRAHASTTELLAWGSQAAVEGTLRTGS